MNRRGLLKRLGAAIVVAPIALVVASEPAKATAVDEASMSDRAFLDALTTQLPGMMDNATVLGRVNGQLEARGYYEPLMTQSWEDGYAEGHEEGLRTGLKARVDSYYSVERLAYVTQASHDGRWAIRLDE